MRRADRLFQIVQHFRGGRLVTAQKLGAWLEVSERTIYRDIADLQSTGVPIDGEAGIGYLMREGFELPPLMYTRSLRPGLPSSSISSCTLRAAASVKIRGVPADR